MIDAEVILSGNAQGKLLLLGAPVSFWGDLNISNGQIADKRHPQFGEFLKDRIVVLPGVKGSTAGPGALLEMLVSGVGPSGFILTCTDIVVALACTTALGLSGKTVPVVRIGSESGISALGQGSWFIRAGQIGREV